MALGNKMLSSHAMYPPNGNRKAQLEGFPLADMRLKIEFITLTIYIAFLKVD